MKTDKHYKTKRDFLFFLHSPRYGKCIYFHMHFHMLRIHIGMKRNFILVYGKSLRNEITFFKFFIPLFSQFFFESLLF